MEINTTANQVYEQNFGDTELLQKNIEVSLSNLRELHVSTVRCIALFNNNYACQTVLKFKTLAAKQIQIHVGVSLPLSSTVPVQTAVS